MTSLPLGGGTYSSRVYLMDWEGPLDLDWRHVLTIDHGDYGWDTLHAWYSPSARQYYWSGDTGCSCNSWQDGLVDIGNFCHGSKADLRQAVRQFVWDFGLHVSYLTRADGTLAAYRPPLP